MEHLVKLMKRTQAPVAEFGNAFLEDLLHDIDLARRAIDGASQEVIMEIVKRRKENLDAGAADLDERRRLRARGKERDR